MSRFLRFCMLCLPALALPAANSYGSINISHPLIYSIGLSQVSSPFVYDAELGFGGSKVGFGLGALQQAGGRGGGIAVKAVIMYTWESPLDSPWEDAELVQENPFLDNETYVGLEGVLAPLPYRFALGAYKVLGDVEGGPDVDLEDEEDIIWGASFGVGF